MTKLITLQNKDKQVIQKKTDIIVTIRPYIINTIISINFQGFVVFP